MSAIFLDQKIVHYEALGRGRPLLFLHGWVGSWRYWIPVMQAASAGFRTYAIDIWGFGDTAKDNTRYNIDTQLELLEKFIDQMGIRRMAVIGHGLGAVLAVMFAKKKPDLVDRLMTISYPSDLELINPRLQTDTPENLADWLFGRSDFVEPLRSDVPKTDPLAVKTFFDDLQKLSLKELSNFCDKNCLMVHGSNDPVIQAPETTKGETQRLFTFEESGHFPMLDESSKFNRLLMDFLSLESGDDLDQLRLKDEWKRRVR